MRWFATVHSKETAIIPRALQTCIKVCNLSLPLDPAIAVKHRDAVSDETLSLYRWV